MLGAVRHPLASPAAVPSAIIRPQGVAHRRAARRARRASTRNALSRSEGLGDLRFAEHSHQQISDREQEVAGPQQRHPRGGGGGVAGQVAFSTLDVCF